MYGQRGVDRNLSIRSTQAAERFRRKAVHLPHLHVHHHEVIGLRCAASVAAALRRKGLAMAPAFG
jgi:hypothetical protein